MATTSIHALEIGEEYLAAWKRKDIKAIERLVDPMIHMKSPITEVTGRDQFLQTCEKIFASLKDVKIHARFGAENEAIFVYDFSFNPPIGVVRTANLMTLEGGKIISLELLFDARPFGSSR